MPYRTPRRILAINQRRNALIDAYGITEPLVLNGAETTVKQIGTLGNFNKVPTLIRETIRLDTLQYRKFQPYDTLTREVSPDEFTLANSAGGLAPIIRTGSGSTRSLRFSAKAFYTFGDILEDVNYKVAYAFGLFVDGQHTGSSTRDITVPIIYDYSDKILPIDETFFQDISKSPIDEITIIKAGRPYDIDTAAIGATINPIPGYGFNLKLNLNREKITQDRALQRQAQQRIGRGVF